MTIENEIDDLGDAIRKSKIEYAKLEGKAKALIERLKVDHDVDTIKECELELKNLQEKLVSINKRLDEKFTKLKEEFEW